MKKTLLLVTFLLVFALAPLPKAEAQTATYSSITTTAINATQLCFVLASTTNMHASGDLTGPNNTPQEWDLWTDGEWMKINTINTTSNQVCVTRGKSPTRGGAHATAQLAFVGPAGASPFILSAPLPTNPGPADYGGQFGSCISTQFRFLPLINVANGSIWDCLTSGQGAHWDSYGFRNWTSGHPIRNIIDAAYTASLADEFITYTSLTTTRILTLPAITGVLGKTMVVTNGGSTSQTITVTPVNGQTIGPAAATTVSNTGPGAVTRLVSVMTTSGTFGWETW